MARTTQSTPAPAPVRPARKRTATNAAAAKDASVLAGVTRTPARPARKPAPQASKPVSRASKPAASKPAAKASKPVPASRELPRDLVTRVAAMYAKASQADRQRVANYLKVVTTGTDDQGNRWWPDHTNLPRPTHFSWARTGK